MVMANRTRWARATAYGAWAGNREARAAYSPAEAAMAAWKGPASPASATSPGRS